VAYGLRRALASGPRAGEPGCVVVLLGASISVAIGEVQWASILSRLLEFVGG
jgi:hypothetical protein